MPCRVEDAVDTSSAASSRTITVNGAGQQPSTLERQANAFKNSMEGFGFALKALTDSAAPAEQISKVQEHCVKQVDHFSSTLCSDLVEPLLPSRSSPSPSPSRSSSD